MTTKQFVGWCCGDKDAAASILGISSPELEEMIEYDKVLDPYRTRLVSYLMEHYDPANKEDALRIALRRCEAKLSRAYQSITCVDPILDL